MSGPTFTLEEQQQFDDLIDSLNGLKDSIKVSLSTRSTWLTNF